MMKNKFFRLGLPVIVLAWGMMVAGCDNGLTHGSGSGGTPKKKSITITGLSGMSGGVNINLFEDASKSPNSPNSDIAEIGAGAPISDGSANVELYDFSASKPWTGSGPYYIWLTLDGYNWLHYKNNPYTIENKTSTIDISDFQ